MPKPLYTSAADQLEGFRRAAKLSIARHREETGVTLSPARAELERRCDQWWARHIAKMREQEALYNAASDGLSPDRPIASEPFSDVAKSK